MASAAMACGRMARMSALSRQLALSPLRGSILQRVSASRNFATSFVVTKKADSHDLAEPSADGSLAIGPGAPPGTVPTDEDQSTGLERFELLHKLQGEEAFYNDPVEITHFGTMDKPIMIKSLFSTRLVGCTGLGDAHETLWMNIHKDKVGRCKECGIVYKLDFVGDEHAEEHH